MKRINISFAFGIGYIAFWIGMVVMDVGKPSQLPEITNWYHVLLIALVFLIPFLAGIDTGKHWNN